MFRRELLRVARCAGVGLLAALALGPHAWMMPLYCVGLWYALPLLLHFLMSFWSLCGQLWCFSLVMGRWIALLLMPFLALVGLVVTLSFGWMPGLLLGARALLLAHRHDSDLRRFL